MTDNKQAQTLGYMCPYKHVQLIDMHTMHMTSDTISTHYFLMLSLQQNSSFDCDAFYRLQCLCPLPISNVGFSIHFSHRDSKKSLLKQYKQLTKPISYVVNTEAQ